MRRRTTLDIAPALERKEEAVIRPQQIVEMESSGKLQNEPLAANRARWTSYRRHSSMSEATRPVQPVWWDAPRPAPLSPW